MEQKKVVFFFSDLYGRVYNRFFIAYLDLEVWKSSQGLRLWWRVSVSGAQAINKNVYMLTTHSLNIITCIACNQIKVMYSTLSNLIQAHHIISNITKRWKLITSKLELYS